MQEARKGYRELENFSSRKCGYLEQLEPTNLRPTVLKFWDTPGLGLSVIDRNIAEYGRFGQQLLHKTLGELRASSCKMAFRKLKSRDISTCSKFLSH